jgi:hypothetical protein
MKRLIRSDGDGMRRRSLTPRQTFLMLALLRLAEDRGEYSSSTDRQGMTLQYFQRMAKLAD